jgi:dTDP-4-dehydrorhamnose reductase
MKQKIVIIGSGGRLGAALEREYRERFDIVGFNHAQLDLGDSKQIDEKLAGLDFDVLINCAALTSVDLCEKDPELAMQINGVAVRKLAEIAAGKNAKVIHFSTDYVFDGEKREPYHENDPANPISVYGESKRAGEENVLKTSSRNLVVRVSWVFGPDRPSFIDGIIKRALEQDHVDAIADKFSAPTYTHDIAQMLPQFFPWHRLPADVPKIIGKMPMSPILHFSNAGECSWQEYAQFALDCCRSLGLPLKARAVEPLKLNEMKNFIAHRPIYSVLSTEKYIALTGTTPRNWRDAVGEYVKTVYSPK